MSSSSLSLCPHIEPSAFSCYHYPQHWTPQPRHLSITQVMKQYALVPSGHRRVSSRYRTQSRICAYLEVQSLMQVFGFYKLLRWVTATITPECRSHIITSTWGYHGCKLIIHMDRQHLGWPKVVGCGTFSSSLAYSSNSGSGLWCSGLCNIVTHYM